MALLFSQRDLVPLLIWKEEVGCGGINREHLLRLHDGARSSPDPKTKGQSAMIAVRSPCPPRARGEVGGAEALRLARQRTHR